MRRQTVDEPQLLAAVLAVPGDLEVAAVLLCGSFARGRADAVSDVDVVALVRGDRAYIRLGACQGRAVEALYTPIAYTLEAPVRRATLDGARVLYDPDGVAAAWLARLRRVFARPFRDDGAHGAYARWDLGQGLSAMEAAAAQGDGAAALYLRGAWLADLVEYVLAARGCWAPTRRRQMAALRECDERAFWIVEACLAAAPGDAAMSACRHAFEELVGAVSLPPLAVAPCWPAGP